MEISTLFKFTRQHPALLFTRPCLEVLLRWRPHPSSRPLTNCRQATRRAQAPAPAGGRHGWRRGSATLGCPRSVPRRRRASSGHESRTQHRRSDYARSPAPGYANIRTKALSHIETVRAPVKPHHPQTRACALLKAQSICTEKTVLLYQQSHL